MSRTGQIISRFPDFYRSGDSENLFYQYVKVFASMLDDAEEDLLRVMKTHWVNTADNEGSKGFDAAEKGDLDKVLALYLESLGGTALLKQGTRRSGAEGKVDDELYRTRILGLIQVLKNGASTRAGIIDIVAANLGIVSDLPYAATAHDSIRIVEFLPETASGSNGQLAVLLNADIAVTNQSPLPAAAEFRLEFQPDLPLPLVNPRISNPATGESVQYIGTVTPGDALYFLSDGSGLFRGQPFTPVGKLNLPPGLSKLKVEAGVGIPQGVFGAGFFNYAQFDVSKVRNVGVFDTATFDSSVFAFVQPVAKLDIRYSLLSPGSFMVIIPWDIPGFSADIAITTHTLERLADFGLPQALLNSIADAPILGKEFETKEAFFTALGPFVESYVGIDLNRQNIAGLTMFGVPGAVMSRMLALLTPDSGVAVFERMADFFTALGTIGDSEKKALYAALGTFARQGSILDMLLCECLFTDKYARFNISPRGQIKAIVDRVKAAGVYAVIAFEKRFHENQQLEEHFGMLLKKSPEDQEMLESNFDILSTQSAVEQQEMSDFFSLAGVFDYTRFNTLNTFA